jgi:FkbM family methyltransferase
MADTRSFFLYRRLARWITCSLRLPFGAEVALRTKHDVASAQDVLCHPFYWQLYSWLAVPPRLVVDAGANCGHFALLVDACSRVAFGVPVQHFVLVEPNPALLPVLRANLERGGLAERCTIVAGLLGARSGSGRLWVHPRNFLMSATTALEGAHPVEVPYVDLGARLGSMPVDLLKLDIEGSEYEFVEHNGGVLAQTRMLLMEIHEAPPDERTAMYDRIAAAGLRPLGRAVDADNLCLRAWSRADAT